MPRVFIVINRYNLESSLDYMVCPEDKERLELNIENKDLISDGEFTCTRCSRNYPIKNGVPYFSEFGNGFEWDLKTDEQAILNSLAGALDDKNQMWSMIIGLGKLFLQQSGDRKWSIDKVFNTVEDLVIKEKTGEDKSTFLTQAATAARYDIEIYRGTFLIPPRISGFLSRNYAGKGIIVEGACATGECLLDIAGKIDSKFYIGTDISGSMVRQAQEKAGKNTLYIQSDITRLPLKKDAGMYVLNNVFDRVVDPKSAVNEADRILESANSFFVLGNCDPLQYTYNTKDGSEILFVPKRNQLSLEQGIKKAGFSLVKEQKGTWNIQTIAYGKESLPYKILVGRR